ncbi:adenylate/guanylate cyclase domain-containing protein, partial [Candidatus Auribacterota bacterium]
MVRKDRFTFFLVFIIISITSAFIFSSAPDTVHYSPFTKYYSHLTPESDFKNDLAIDGWGLSAIKDLKKKAKKHTGKYIRDLTIDDLYGSKAFTVRGRNVEDIYREQGYAFDMVPDEGSFLLAGKDHGVIFHAAEYPPAADILSSKEVLKKGKLNKNVAFIIYKDLYKELFEDLNTIESDVRNLAAYVPIEIVEEVLKKELPALTSKQKTMDAIFSAPLVFDDSTVVSIDLSGFTAMTDHLTRVLSKEQDPIKQGEAKKFVIDITNELFADIESAIEKLGGSVIKFGGDARLVLFTGENTATRALEMSQEVQIIIRYFGGIIKEFFTEAVGGDQLSNIKASIGMSSGTATLLIASDKSGLRDVIPLGDTFDRTIAAEDASNKDIVITEETRQRLIKEGRKDLFTLYDTGRLPDDLYDPGERKELSDKQLYVVDQDNLNFLDYEVRDRVNFTLEYINTIYDYLKENGFKDAGPDEVKGLTSDFEAWKGELGQMQSTIAIGDISKDTLNNLSKMKKRVRKIRVAVDEQLLKFFPGGKKEDIETTQENLAKLSLKRDYGRYIADRVGDLFRHFRKTAREKAFYTPDTLKRAKKIFVSFLPRDFDQYIVKEGRKDAAVERMNFQNARIMFVQAYGTKELYEKTLKEEGPEKAQEKVNEFFNETRRLASPNNGIIYLKCDPGIGYIKLIFFGGLKYISGINPDAEMVKLGMKLHEIGEKYGIQFRGGINSGSVIFGLTGTARNEYTTISAAVNMAARYAAKAKKGETLITSRIYYGSRDWMEHKERDDLYPEGKGGLMLKGIRDPQRAFQPVSMYKTQKRGAFLRLKEFNTAQKLIDEYTHIQSRGEGKGGFGAVLFQTKELGLGSETLAYEIERYAGMNKFAAYGGKGKDEFEIMKNLLEGFFEISSDDPYPERLKKINFSVSKYASDMTGYISVLKILFPYIHFEKSDEVDNLEDDEKITVLNRLAQTLFTNKEKELKKQNKAGIFIRIFDLHNIKGGSTFLAPLISALNNRNIFMILVSNAPLPDPLRDIEVRPQAVIKGKRPKPVTLSNFLSDNERTIFVDKMTKDQILDVFHYTCELRDKTALLKEVDRLSHDEIRELIASTPRDLHAVIEDLGRPIDKAFSHIPLDDLHSYVKKLLDGKIYQLSGHGNPLIARHQAKRVIDKFHHEGLPEAERGRFIVGELLRQKIAGDNIDDFFYTQYRDSYFENEIYRAILFDALCLGPEIDRTTLIESARSRNERPQLLIDELLKVGIYKEGDTATIIFDHYVYDVFIKHVDIDRLRRNKLKLAHLIENLHRRDDGTIDPDHINELAQLYTDSFNLNLSWKKQRKTLGIKEEDLEHAAAHNLAASRRYQELIRVPEAIKAIEMAISVLDYEIRQNIAGEDAKNTILAAYKNLGELYKTVGNYESALESFSNALNYCGNDIERIGILFDGITFIQFRLDKIDELEKTLEEVISIIPHIEPIERRDAFRINFLNRFGLINQ